VANPAWSPNTPVAVGKVIIDPNGNVQQWSGAAGTSTGAIPPVFGNVLNVFTADGNGGWTCVAVLEVVSLPTGIVSLPVPQFVNDSDGLDPTLIRNDMIATFQALANRTLYPPRSRCCRLTTMLTASHWCAMRFSTQRCSVSLHSRHIQCLITWGSSWA